MSIMFVKANALLFFQLVKYGPWDWEVKIGFHSSSWTAESIQDYYTSEKDTQGWGTPFDFASWLYEDTQAEIFSEFE